MIFHQTHNSQRNYNYNLSVYSDTLWSPHFHKNFEFISVDAGEVPLSVNGNQYTLYQGDCALILSNQIHSFLVPSEASATVIVFSEEYVPAFASHIKGLDSKEPIFRLTDSVRNFFYKNIIEDQTSIFMRKACFYAICDEFLSKVKLKERTDTDKESIVRILDWIEVHFTENISLREVASVFGYEYHYLSRLFNKSYGISFTDLLNGYRIERATELLQSTTLPITNIALTSGFQSVRNFNLVFRSITGQSPKEFRG